MKVKPLEHKWIYKNMEPNLTNLDWAKWCYKYIKYLKHATHDNLMNLFELAKSNRADNYLTLLSISGKRLPHGMYP
jgi:hypothetical protein